MTPQEQDEQYETSERIERTKEYGYISRAFNGFIGITAILASTFYFTHNINRLNKYSRMNITERSIAELLDQKTKLNEYLESFTEDYEEKLGTSSRLSEVVSEYEMNRNDPDYNEFKSQKTRRFLTPIVLFALFGANAYRLNRKTKSEIKKLEENLQVQNKTDTKI